MLNTSNNNAISQYTPPSLVQLFVQPLDEDSTITYSTLDIDGSGAGHTVTTTVESSFAELEMDCAKPSVRDNKVGKAFCPFLFEPNTRNNNNAQYTAMLVFDLDAFPEHVTASDVLGCISGYRSFCYSTFSHKLEGKGSCFRALVLLESIIPASEYKRVVTKFGKRFESLGNKIDISGTTPAQYFYLPAVKEERLSEFEFKTQDGDSLDWTKVGHQECDVDYKIESRQLPQVKVIDDKTDSKIIPEGQRNSSLYKLAVNFMRQGMSAETLLTRLMEINEKSCVPPLELREVETIAKSASKESELLDGTGGKKLTETKMAESVANHLAGNTQWISSVDSWRRFDPETGLWECIDSTDIHKSIITYQNLRKEMVQINTSATDASRAGAYKELEKSERSSFITGVEKLLRTFQEKLSPSDFDNNVYLVGLQGGQCLDLKSLEVRKIQHDDYLMKSLSVSYEEGADCPIWKKSMNEWCRYDPELVKFLQVWAGYCLSGLTEFQGFLFLYGEGRNGKSVFINTLTEIMNDYASTLKPENLMVKYHSNNNANGEIAGLLGVRLASSNELPEGGSFDENLLKQLTGGDNITARHMYKSHFTFKPNSKLVIAGNHKPIVRGSDFGFWRRMHLVPFLADIKEPDPQLFIKLRNEKSGILNWLIEGWKIYASEGLIIPDAIKNESKRYQEDMDLIAQWMVDRVFESKGNKIPAEVLFLSYQSWCKNNGHTSGTSRAFKDKLRKHMPNCTRSNKGWVYLDVAVNYSAQSNYDS